MDKLLAIIKREYFTRIKTKGFILGTILTPLLMTGLIFIPLLFLDKGGKTLHRLVVLDQTGDEAIYQRALTHLTTGKKPLLTDDPITPEARGRNTNAVPDGATFEVRREAVTADRLEARQQELNQEIKAERLDGYVVLPADVLTRGKLLRRARNANDFDTNRRLRDAFNDAIIEQRLHNAGVKPQDIETINQDIGIDFLNERGEKESPLGQWSLSVLLGVILYMTILIYGMYVLQGVIEEKQSRIVEVLLSSVKPFQLMLGKVVGIGLVSLTQILVWAASLGLISAFAAAQAIALGSFKIPRIPLTVLFFFAVYFVLGYFLFATLYALVGSMVSSQEDGQQAQFPVTMLVALPMALMTVIMTKPDSVLSTVLSLIPFFGPILMFMRITVQPPPWWQIALSILLLLGTILGTIWVAAKIYRVGVLMYGKRPSLPEVMKWLKYT
ncbi:MAG TPA: ABC transporter permease [Blastocatellia bacterium]|nr:ABC transporter permease [Blastocatellia bacterium]